MRLPGAGADAGEDHNYAPAIYGSLLVTSVIAVQWRTDAVTDGIALFVVFSVLVFWLAHAWSEIVNRRVRGQVSVVEAREIAFDEASMLSSLLVPALVLAVAPRVGATIDTAVALALIVSIAQVFLWGLVVGRAAHRGWALPLVVATVDSLLGVAIVALKVAVLH
jgi:hypothetical protein